MRCANCRHDNQAESRFCAECGQPLAPTCPACGAECEAGAKFCTACGAPMAAAGAAPPTRALPAVPPHLAAKIRDARSSLDSEPRTVTILFVDTVSSMAATDGLELEEVHRAVRDQSQLMADAVHEYEGTVLQFLGDGLMAAFGAPIAHEDSARRAVAAALSMRDRLAAHAETLRTTGGPTLQYRIGLNTGPVIVGGVGDDLSMEYTAVGDTVNLAARMEQTAEPGTIYVTEHTRHQAEGYFEFHDLGALDVKGKAEPVPAHQVVRELRARTRFDLAQQRGLTPLVGRDTELATLGSYFGNVRDGAGQVVSIVGEAGIGKSRLLMEFRESLGDASHTWLQGQCITYGKTIPYTPIVGVLKAGFAIADGDSEEQIVAKVTEATAGWDAAARDLAPYLRFLLAVDPGDAHVAQMDPMERRVGILEAIRASVEQASRGGPLVVAIEDLHWIDERSEEALFSLVDVVAGLPVLLLLTYRPGYTTTIPDRAYVSRIGVRALSQEGAIALARNALVCPDLSGQLCTRLVAKAEGNPFFIEEVLLHLTELGALERTNGSFALKRPLSTDDVPDTVEEVIRARMDRLETPARETLQVAAVIGREFASRLLARISELGQDVRGELDALQAVELILRKGYFPELEYMFKHALTCDVAYQSLLSQRRRALHRLIAAAVEELYADRLSEQYGTLAHHWHEGQDWEKALHYLPLAAAQAAARYANQDALDYYDRALEVCDRLGTVPGEVRRSLHSQKALLQWVIADMAGASASYRTVLELAREDGDRAAEGEAMAQMGHSLLWGHVFDEAEEAAIGALAIADELQDDAVRAGAFATLGDLKLLCGDAVGGQEVTAEAVHWSQVSGRDDWLAFSAGFMNLGHNWQGEFETALQGYDAIITGSVAAVSVLSNLSNHWQRTLPLAGMGRYTEAAAACHAIIARCLRLGDIFFLTRGWNTLGWIHNDLYDWERGSDYNRRCLRLAEEKLPDAEIMSNAQLNLGDAALGVWDYAAAEALIQPIYDALPEYHEWMKWRYSQHCFHSLGEVRLAQGQYERALELADACLALAESTRSRKNIVKARRLRGQLFAVEGAPEEAEAEFHAALEIARPLGNPPQLWKTFHALGDLHAQRGKQSNARAAFAEALAVIEQTAAGLDDADLKATFLAAPEVAAIGRAATG